MQEGNVRMRVWLGIVIAFVVGLSAVGPADAQSPCTGLLWEELCQGSISGADSCPDEPERFCICETAAGCWPGQGNTPLCPNASDFIPRVNPERKQSICWLANSGVSLNVMEFVPPDLAEAECQMNSGGRSCCFSRIESPGSARVNYKIEQATSVTSAQLQLGSGPQTESGGR